MPEYASEAVTRTVIVVNDVAHVNGGTAQVALLGANGLASLGYKVYLFTATPPAADSANLHSGVEVVCTDQQEILLDSSRIRASVQGLWNFRAAKLLERLLSKCKREDTIVHLHGWTKALSSSVAKTAMENNFAIVCTIYDYFLACPNGGFYNFQNNRICKLKPLSLDCIRDNCDVRNYGHKLWRVARQAVQRNIGGMPSAIKNFIACSEMSLEVMRPYLPSDCKIHWVPNPINVARQQIVDVGGNDSFTFVGRMSAEKGPSLLASAARRLGCPVTFVGEGVCSDDVRSIYREANITGWIASNCVQEFLKRARALVFPSLWCEVQGLVVLEAAALGIPAIVPDTAATREMVVDGVTGLWFKGGDEDDLVNKMKVLQNADTAGKLGRAAYDKYWANPASVQSHVEQLDICYQDIFRSNSQSLIRRSRPPDSHF
jgi:glycosyltransferase involved in cell wall biosynthesis